MTTGEVSAFQADEEMKEDEQIVKAEVMSKLQTQTLAKRKELTAKFRPFAIDNVAAKAYFEKYKEAINSEE